MVEESPPPVPPLDESIEAETDAAREPKAALVEPALAKPVFVCDCEVHLRHACEGADFYKEEKGKLAFFTIRHKTKLTRLEKLFERKSRIVTSTSPASGFPRTLIFGVSYSTRPPSLETRHLMRAWISATQLSRDKLVLTTQHSAAWLPFTL